MSGPYQSPIEARDLPLSLDDHGHFCMGIRSITVRGSVNVGSEDLDGPDGRDGRCAFRGVGIE
jgi:hypothetical protein